jgi:4'-phosphopantetheinyl transferase
MRSSEPIGPGEVHAWVADLDGAGRAAANQFRRRHLDTAPLDTALLDTALLDTGELARAVGYARPRDGARFAGSRACLRLVLGQYLDADPAGLRYTTGPDGRPVLAGAHAGRLQFSLSRSGGRVLIAVSLTPVGGDIEIVRPRAGLADLIASRFGAAEAACIKAGCGGSPARGFYRHWTAKEAYLKATGRGLAGLRATELACAGPDIIRVDGSPADGWTLSLPQAAPDCAMAIVGSGPVTHCRPWVGSGRPVGQ